MSTPYLRSIFIYLIVLCSLAAKGQQGLEGAVPVKEEPRHKPVFQNRYVRVLDVWLAPGDTTLYHIHSTPSLFNFFTNGKLSTQVRTGPWELSQPKAGFSWYRSFEKDTLIHRIINVDTVPCHVMDIELIGPYSEADAKPEEARLPFELLYENERAAAYRITKADFANYKFYNRGPIIAEVVAGNDIMYHNDTKPVKKKLQSGMYQYIEPGDSFHFSNEKNNPVHIVLFELK